MTAIDLRMTVARHDERISSLERSEGDHGTVIEHLDERINRIYVAIIGLLGSAVLAALGIIVSLILKLTGHL